MLFRSGLAAPRRSHAERGGRLDDAARGLDSGAPAFHRGDDEHGLAGEEKHGNIVRRGEAGGIADVGFDDGPPEEQVRGC